MSLSLLLLYTAAGCETKWGLVRGRSGFKTKRFGLSTACRFDQSDSGRRCLLCKAVKLICDAFFVVVVAARLFMCADLSPGFRHGDHVEARGTEEAPFSAAPSVLSFLFLKKKLLLSFLLESGPCSVSERGGSAVCLHF